MANHWRKMFDKENKHLGAWDLEVNGKFTPKVVTIEKFYQDVLIGTMGKENKVFVKLKEFNKSMVCNPTNFKRLQKFFNSFDTDAYIGKQITLGVEKVKSPQDGDVDALRFSTYPLPQSKAKPVITDDKFPAALEAVKTGAMTIDKVKEMYEVTPAQLKALDEVQK
jgi:hypothetical protein